MGRTSLVGCQPVTEPFRMGRAYGNGHYYDGLLDDVHYYDSPLSDYDVELLYEGYRISDLGSDRVSTVVKVRDASASQGNELAASLLDQRGRILVGVTLSFILDGKKIGKGVTDSHGYARIHYDSGKPNAKALTATFEGADCIAGASETVHLTMVAQAVPLQQYVIIGVDIAAAVLGIATVLLLSRRRRGRSSEELAQAIRDALTKP
ncbi:hypothetical protein MUP00_11300 [Candidatus Bathyarchaeota archaeon]|nr:hypothetical protein [Candidatus Bathyarchaeota archaeon]